MGESTDDIWAFLETHTLSGVATYINCFRLPSENDLLERKEFAPLGTKLFPFTKDHFQKELEMQETEQEITILSPL